MTAIEIFCVAAGVILLLKLWESDITFKTRRRRAGVGPGSSSSKAVPLPKPSARLLRAVSADESGGRRRLSTASAGRKDSPRRAVRSGSS